MKRDYIFFVVDDSPLLLEEITRELKKLVSCKIFAFTTADECIRHLGLEPDLILTDLHLHEEKEENLYSGDQLVAKVKDDYPHIPVIVYSSGKNFDEVLRMMKAGVSDFIPKQQNFLSQLSSSVCKTLRQVSSKYKEKKVKNLMLFSCFLFATSLLVLNYINPYILMEVMIFMLIFWFLFVFVIFETGKKIPDPLN